MIDIVWIDDQDVTNYTEMAESFDLNILWYSNWEDAARVIDTKYANIGAIIFDYHCKLNNNEIENNDFLRNALYALNGINGKHNAFIPWYVCSAGSANGTSFADQIGRDLIKDREVYDGDWTKGYYSKLSREDTEALFQNIKNTVSKSNLFLIKQRYKPVFDVVDDRNIFPQDTLSETFVDLLSAFHYDPSSLARPSLIYNRLRQMLEDLLLSMNREGILPDECLDNGIPIVKNSMYYLCGKRADVFHNRHYDYSIRYKSGSILPPIICANINNVKDLGDKCSHTYNGDLATEEDLAQFDEDYFQVASHNLLFSSVLQLCDVFAWYGRYLKSSNRERDFSGVIECDRED